MISTDPKSIYKRLQDAADQVAISVSDLSDIDAIDETLDQLVNEALPLIISQIGHIGGLREKIRREKHGE